MKTPGKLRRSNDSRISRRTFVRGATAAASLALVPRHVLGGRGYVAPSDKITLACVGTGSQGTRVMMNFLEYPDVRVVAVADPNRESADYVEWGKNEIRDKERRLLGAKFSDWGSDWAGAVCGREPARRLVEAFYASRSTSGKSDPCRAYADYRELLEEEIDLDAVIVGSTDHTHAVIALAAMRKRIHVYCQKPMTHSILEARRLAEVARETGVATQVAVGNQASEDTRLLCEWVWAGAIGSVRRVVNWSSRPFWPQGIARPENEEAVPEGLDWELWLGPAPYRPFHHAYHPFVWRGWFDFGTGPLGDMGCYSFDTLFRVLRLEAPSSVEGSSTAVNDETFPLASIVHFHFPARGETPPVTVTWYDGGLKPPRPEELEESHLFGEDDGKEGLMLLGDNGTILCGFNGRKPRLIPESKMRAFQPPPKSLPRSPGHDREWLDAIKGGAPAGANFEFTARVTETILLGNVALRAGKKLAWDATNMKVANDPEAAKFLHREYRAGWTL
jgi:predicted dehydrogenase